MNIQCKMCNYCVVIWPTAMFCAVVNPA